jgi:uncharacterized membrane protein YqiK
MEWYFTLAIIVAIMIITVPIVFIWYINVSGLYQVMREARQRQKRREMVLKGAGELARR